jgi:hypothetical protein
MSVERELPPDAVPFSDADLQDTLLRAARFVAIAAAILLPYMWWKMGWRSAALFVIGAIIAMAALNSWRKMARIVMERMDAAPDAPAPPVRGVVLRFMLRFFLAAGLLYVSLSSLHGSAYALLAGLVLSVAGVAFEALRLVRRWM